MLEARGGTGLAEESIRPVPARALRAHDLEGDPAFEASMPRFEYVCHPARADEPNDFVFFGYDGPRTERFGHSKVSIRG